MRNNYRTLLYFTIILIILGSLFILFLRQTITDSLGTKVALDSYYETPANGMAASSRNLNEVDILKNSRFISLKNNVINFDFDNICGGQGVKLASGKASACTLGNNRPFAEAEISSEALLSGKTAATSSLNTKK